VVTRANPKVLVTPPSRFNKYYTVHNVSCRYYATAHGQYVDREDVEDLTIDCKVCGGLKPDRKK
jgi:hypothetical protein